MRRLALALALTSVGVCLNGGVAEAVCAADTVTVTPTIVVAGGAVTVEADGTLGGPCNDVGGSTVGGCGKDEPLPKPHTAALRLLLGDREFRLGNLEPSGDGPRRQQVQVPSDVPAGTWQLQVVSKDMRVVAEAVLIVRGS